MAKLKLTPRVVKARIAIANDVIDQIKAGRYTPEELTYVEGRLTGSSDREGDLQKLINQQVTKKDPCTVCALGSAILSAVRLYDDVTFGEIFTTGGTVKQSGMRRKLREFFFNSELEVIEATFEVDSSFIGGQSRHSTYSDPSTWPKYVKNARHTFDTAHKFKSILRALSMNDRLTLIMQAVADNADVKITLSVVREWLHMELLVNPLLAKFRADYAI